MIRRAGTLLTGSVVSTVCYAVTIRADIGLGPLFAVQDGVARHAGITLGHAVMVVGVVLIMLAIALRSWPGPGTVVLPFFGGAVLDLLLPHVPSIDGYIWKFVAVVVASWMMALGGALMIVAAVGVAALDAVMLGLHRIVRRPIGRLRLAMEITMLVTGWLLGGSIGVGTVITGVLIGPGLQFWLRVLGHSASAGTKRPELLV